jgi:cellulose synthase (UDP-forming)
MDEKSSQNQSVLGVSQQGAAAALAPLTIPEGKTVESARLPRRRRLRLAITRFVAICAVVFTIRYFYWRSMYTMNPAAKGFFYAFLVAEVLSFLESVLFYFIVSNPTHYASRPPLPGRSVDVFIPTYNEPVEILRETVLCAISIRYPHKTYILDDGQREELRQLAHEFNCGYITRGDRTHAKAGNLNNALAQTSGEFIVTLDADHVASPDLIQDTLGFFADPKVSVVQGTQDFYNLDSFQHLVNWKSRVGWQQQELFFSVIQPGKDRYNAAFYCGSPGIVRRSALEDIGGFPVETITEDMHTGLRMQKKGWRVLYFNRTLARGLAPQTYSGFATQWQRWGTGAMQVLRKEKIFFGKGLTFGQRLCYFSSFYFYCMSYVKLFFVVTPILCLSFAVFPLVTEPRVFGSFFLPYFVLNIVCSVLAQGGVRNFFSSERFNLLKIHVLMKTLAGLFRRHALFFVTPKSRAAAARASEVLLPLVVLIGLAISLFIGVFRMERVPLWGYTFWALVVNIFWAVVFLIMIGGVVQRSLQRKELRASYRFPSRLDTRLRVTYTDHDGSEVRREQFARNLNRFGVSLTLESAIECGTPVKLELLLPERTVNALGKVVRNQRYDVNSHPRIANGIRFEKISPSDQDAISRFLFWEIAPREARVMNLTARTQASEEGS